MTRIVLVHAVTVAIEPVQTAFAELWPEAETVNLLDDALSRDRARDGELTEAMSNRIGALGRYGLFIGADGILYTCSAFGPAIEAFARSCEVPVLKPNEAMFRTALELGTRIGMLATFAPSVASMEAEFRDMAAAAGSQASIETVLVPEAMAALNEGDAAGHNSMLARAADQLRDRDVVLLAQFSTSRAHAAVSNAVPCPVLTSPAAAVAELRTSLDA